MRERFTPSHARDRFDMYSQRSNLSGRPLILPGLHAGLRVTRGFLISATILLFGTPDHPFTLSAQDPPNRQPISADILLRGGTVIDGNRIRFPDLRRRDPEGAIDSANSRNAGGRYLGD